MRVEVLGVLGKHSDIYGDLKAKDFTALSDKPDDVAAFQRVLEITGRSSLGWNPFEYMNFSCSKCGLVEGGYDTLDQFLACCDEKYCLQKCAPLHKEQYHSTS